MKAAPDWLGELALEPGPPWHQMGTRSLSSHGWPQHDGDAAEQLVLKRQLIDRVPDVVIGMIEGSEASAAEAASLVAGADSLVDAALAVQDDLCVLRHRDGHWRLDAGVVCFPSMWRLADKLGSPMGEVHGPVPAYAEELAQRVDRFLDRLRPERPVWRRNWFIHHLPDLHQPGSTPPLAPGFEVPEDLWLRSERQTLHRLPRTGAILFTIRTQQVPLEVVAQRPAIAEAMASAIEAWSDELVAYRAAAPWRDAVIRWLREVAA